MSKKLYKILVNGKSCHCGDMEWSLPKKVKGKWVAGAWHEVKGDIKVCQKGLHLTTEPYNWYKWGCTNYEAEADDVVEWKGEKCAARKVRLLKEVPHPKWWTDTEGWIKTLKEIAWLKPDGKPKKEWKLFETRAAAGAAALYARGIIVADLKLEAKHRTYIKARMEVWQKGYGLLYDVDGVLYVYKKV